jgi:hypothetical protein
MRRRHGVGEDQVEVGGGRQAPGDGDHVVALGIERRTHE